MSDYELLDIFMTSVDALWVVFSTFVSIVFAFLVFSYLAAGKLRRSLAGIVVTLYSLVTLWSGWAMSRGSATVTAIGSQIKTLVQDGSSTLGWHPAANMPDFVIAVIPVLITLIAFLTYVGSVFFFYIQRKHALD